MILSKMKSVVFPRLTMNILHKEQVSKFKSSAAIAAKSRKKPPVKA